MRVVRREDGQIEFARESDQILVHPGEFRDAVLLQFDVETIFENVLVPTEHFARFGVLAIVP